MLTHERIVFLVDKLEIFGPIPWDATVHGFEGGVALANMSAALPYLFEAK